MAFQVVRPNTGVAPLLIADGVSLEYGATRATHDVSFNVYRGCLLYTSPSPRD